MINLDVINLDVINTDLINIVNVVMNRQSGDMASASNASPTDHRPTAPAGLKGLVVAETSVGSVRGDLGFFHYRDHNAISIARHQTFEAATGLLVDGSLPDGPDETAIRSELAGHRCVDAHVLDAVTGLARAGFDRMSSLPGLRAALTLLVDDTPSLDLSHAERRDRVLRVIGATPTLLAAMHRASLGQPVLGADPGLGHAVDYVRMTTGVSPTPRLARAVETYLLLTADHGFNASTFTSRVVTSTGAGIGSAYAAALGALSGPLHGGAPSRVLDMIEAIGDPQDTESWARRELESGRKLMGFGHAVYRADDPRSALLREVASGLGGELVERSVEIEERMLRFLAESKPDATIVTNVEFYAAVVLHLAGIPQDMFTPTFTTSRVVGWGAHLLEQAASNKIIRPSARYVGPPVPA